MMAIIISCAGDAELAERLRQFLLLSKVSSHASVSIENDEISIENEQSVIQSKDVRRLLEGFLASNSDLAGYSVTKFGELFTIGMARSIDDLVTRCEICGYLAHHEDELIIHKRMHGLFVPV